MRLFFIFLIMFIICESQIIRIPEEGIYNCSERSGVEKKNVINVVFFEEQVSLIIRLLNEEETFVMDKSTQEYCYYSSEREMKCKLVSRCKKRSSIYIEYVTKVNCKKAEENKSVIMKTEVKESNKITIFKDIVILPVSPLPPIYSCSSCYVKETSLAPSIRKGERMILQSTVNGISTHKSRCNIYLNKYGVKREVGNFTKVYPTHWVVTFTSNKRNNLGELFFEFPEDSKYPSIYYSIECCTSSEEDQDILNVSIDNHQSQQIVFRCPFLSTSVKVVKEKQEEHNCSSFCFFFVNNLLARVVNNNTRQCEEDFSSSCQRFSSPSCPICNYITSLCTLPSLCFSPLFSSLSSSFLSIEKTLNNNGVSQHRRITLNVSSSSSPLYENNSVFIYHCHILFGSHWLTNPTTQSSFLSSTSILSVEPKSNHSSIVALYEKTLISPKFNLFLYQNNLFQKDIKVNFPSKSIFSLVSLYTYEFIKWENREHCKVNFSSNEYFWYISFDCYSTNINYFNIFLESLTLYSFIINKNNQIESNIIIKKLTNNTDTLFLLSFSHFEKNEQKNYYALSFSSKINQKRIRLYSFLKASLFSITSSKNEECSYDVPNVSLCNFSSSSSYYVVIPKNLFGGRVYLSILDDKNNIISNEIINSSVTFPFTASIQSSTLIKSTSLDSIIFKK